MSEAEEYYERQIKAKIRREFKKFMKEMEPFNEGNKICLHVYDNETTTEKVCFDTLQKKGEPFIMGFEHYGYDDVAYEILANIPYYFESSSDDKKQSGLIFYELRMFFNNYGYVVDKYAKIHMFLI